jgi:hypothetical protein
VYKFPFLTEDIRGLKFKSKELKLSQYANDAQIVLGGSGNLIRNGSSSNMQYTTEFIIENKNSYPLLKCISKIKEGKIFYYFLNMQMMRKLYLVEVEI